MTYTPPRAPGVDERFVVRQLTREDAPFWYHVYSKRAPYAANTALSFNQGWGSTRFAPIRLADGSWAHTYYVASSREGAYLESVLHDIPLGVAAFFDKTGLDVSYLARIQLSDPFEYVSLHSHDLPALGLTRAQLIDSLPADYGLTRPWAEAALIQRPGAAAIGYTSRRNDSARCLMLVEQRMPRPPFTVVENTCIGSSPALRREVLDLVSSLGISVL
ncbi:RES family NAD+ phosphorylase [uncultured Azohydromonas sp.]|jgi:RES domain.|uniref:RES family NAD+ phosphorylase n=1 Tax=uncultured Azohydromonas sp. TaxID=487342 RepID=UPI00261DB051|nr:RES family NAD+ phosphorylase [uncultured Azohydromonas sp.]